MAQIFPSGVALTSPVGLFSKSPFFKQLSMPSTAYCRALTDLFGTGFANCTVTRITDQRKGEPDLLMTFPGGKKVTVQVTAKQSPTQFVDSKKAGDIIPQSARFHPDGFMCIGRPDFQELAREQAVHLSQGMNFKLLPIYVLAELYVQTREGVIDANAAERFLFSARGYLTIAEIRGLSRSAP